MDRKPVTRTVNKVQTKDPIDVIAGLDRGEERPVPADGELKSASRLHGIWPNRRGAPRAAGAGESTCLGRPRSRSR